MPKRVYIGVFNPESMLVLVALKFIKNILSILFYRDKLANGVKKFYR